jgi:hypothetical protein
MSKRTVGERKRARHIPTEKFKKWEAQAEEGMVSMAPLSVAKSKPHHLKTTVESEKSKSMVSKFLNLWSCFLPYLVC